MALEFRVYRVARQNTRVLRMWRESKERAHNF